MKYFRLALIAILCAGIIAIQSPGALAFERVPTMTLSEIEPGMRGIGKTVILGTEIVEFNIEIIDIIEKGGFSGGSLILARCWGPTIDKTGGIAGGYSGSPIYIDGKLIGALSAGWYFTDGDIAGITPIHDMLDTFNYSDDTRFWKDSDLKPLETPLPAQLTHKGRTFGKVVLLNSERQAESGDYSDDTLVMVASKTPLLVGGLDERFFPLVKKELESRLPYFDVLQGVGSGVIPTNLTGAHLEPGAAIGVQIASGDIDLTAIGTLTYVDDTGRVLAFGHPFFQNGFVDMPLTTAKIVYTVPSIERSFKIGEAIETVGRITQDRGTCVGGWLGQEADMLDFRITVSDEDINRKKTYECKIIRDEELMAYFWMMVPLQAIAETLDRAGGGLMDVTFDVYADGFDEPISMNNVFYSQGGFGGYYAVSELAMVIDGLMGRNIYRDAKIESIEMKVVVSDKNATLNILKAESIMPEREEDEDGEELLDGEVADDVEGMEDDVLEGDEAENGDEPESKAIQFAPRQVPPMPLVYLSRNPIGREIIRLNAGDDVLKAVEDYVATVEEEEEDFYELPQYYAGETVEAIVTVLPYRGKAFEKTISLVIPDDYPVGVYNVTISAGNPWGMGGGIFDPFMMAFSGGGGYYGYAPPKTLEDMMDEIIDRERNDMLVFSLAPMFDDDPYAYLRENYKDPEPIESAYPMDGVVLGYFTLPIEIISNEYDDYEDEVAPPQDVPDEFYYDGMPQEPLPAPVPPVE